MIQDLESKLARFDDLATRCDRLQGRQHALIGELESVQRELICLKGRKSLYAKVVEALKFIIEKTTERDLKKVETFVSLGLREVLTDQKIGCRVKAEGSSKVSIYGVKGDMEGSFLDSFGGGVWNVSSVILRIIAILKSNLRRRLFLDESFNNLHVSYLENLGDFLCSLVTKLHFKTLLVTHQELLAERSHKVYEAFTQGGQMKMRCIKR